MCDLRLQTAMVVYTSKKLLNAVLSLESQRNKCDSQNVLNMFHPKNCNILFILKDLEGKFNQTIE